MADINTSLDLFDFEKYSMQDLPIKSKSIINKKTGEVVGIPCRRKTDNQQGYYFVETKEFVGINSVEDLIIMMKGRQFK